MASLPRALAYARGLLRDPALAEDVVQDCYGRLLAKANQYNLPRDGLKILLRSIANACIDQRARRRLQFSLNDMDQDSAQGEKRSSCGISDPIALAMRNELARKIEEGLAQLPMAQRAALQLVVLGYSLTEVAEMLDVSYGNVRVLVHRAREAMRGHLRDYLDE